jgi:hypothetical protein
MDSNIVALTGTIGTWAGVFIGLLALVAVLGPILVWAASRTERNKALHAAGDANQSFIGSGIHFIGLDVRLLRRIKAPIIDKVPDELDLIFDHKRFTETNSRATWVQFANLLLGYGMTFSRGDNLLIHRGRAILPVHRIWILAIGLAGRYSTAQQQKRRKLTMTMSTARVHFTDSSTTAESNSLTPWTIRTELNGSTGQMRVSERVPGLGFSDSSIIIFSPRPASELVDLGLERVSSHDLFMLAIGCLPLPSGQYISLVDLWSEDEVHLDASDPVGVSMTPAFSSSVKFRRLPTMSWSEIISKPDPVAEPVTPTLSRRVTSQSRAQMQLVEAGEPVLLRLDKVALWDDEVQRLRGPFKKDIEGVYALEVQAPDPVLFANLRERMAMTYTEPSFEYVRLPKRTNDSSDKLSNRFIWRADVQKLAWGLLTIPWHPQGYLIGGSSSATCIQLLESSAREFLYLLTRTRENIESIIVSADIKARLKTACDEVDKSVRREQSGGVVSSFQEFCSLDNLLSSCGHPDRVVNDMISVMMITNEEFASFVRQSARHFNRSINGTIDVALGLGAIQVKLPFGGSQDFPVDLKDIYPDWVPRDQTVAVSYTIMILACLRASMRSYLLLIRVSGHPLIKEVMQMDDAVYVA